MAIGGSFRMHDILAETGCELVEVGTTNRTSLDDYRRALTPDALVVKVHRSNFHQEGFTESVPLADLAELCRAGGQRLMYDAGSGALFPFAELGLGAEPTLADDIATGADIVTCSGDKLLGGTQVGMILGRRDLIAGMRKHPMRRAFRIDKSTMGAVDAVLSLYLAAEDRPAIPTIEILGRTTAEIDEAARELLEMLTDDAPAGWGSPSSRAHSIVATASAPPAESPARTMRSAAIPCLSSQR